ncbi:hypothetical protein M3212_05460 [Alkalihalobacillus oceani]|uniref:hypothetical protein n=1 Tax=Halalkalibacter oceani TaxID=1653776 RepID=UPI00203CE6F0|nr:hypothetical protein [Halalkalibacter oceani]MCM3760235.1 hypothetical protein [Halalkalibacter oceani]
MRNHDQMKLLKKDDFHFFSSFFVMSGAITKKGAEYLLFLGWTESWGTIRNRLFHRSEVVHLNGESHRIKK